MLEGDVIGVEPEDNNDAAAQFLGPEADSNPSPAPAAVPVQPEKSKTQFVALAAERRKEALPQGILNIGQNTSIDVPDEEGQIQGFEVSKEDAATLVAQFRQYKFVVEKGQATPQVNI